MRAPSARRGMSLVELLVSLVIMSIVMLAVMTVFIAVQRSYERISRTKSAIEGSRAAVSYVERQVRMAGYGLDPRYAFDFEVGGSLSSKDNLSVGTFNAVPVVTDDLAFRYRDPNYLRRGGVSGTTLTIGSSTLGSSFGVAFEANQRFLVMCPGGADWGVYQLNSAQTASQTSATVTRVTSPFPAPSTPPPCLAVSSGASAAYITILQERRIRIRSINGRPFLVAYRSIRDASGTVVQPDASNLNYDPIAADVEDFQVAYVMNRPGSMAAGGFRSACCAGATAVDSAGNSNWILMDAANETVPDGNPLSGISPALDLAYDSTNRYTSHAANIRQVRANLVVRSQRQDRSNASRPLSLENYVRSSPPLDGFLRLPMTTTIRVPNMLSRTTFTPDLRTSAGEGNFNGG